MRTAAVRRSIICAILAASLICAKDEADARLDELSREAMSALAAQEYGTAILRLGEGSRLAQKSGSLRRAALFENGLCGANFIAMQYRASLRACSQAISLAEGAGDREIMGVAELNRSGFLLSLGELRASRIGLERALGWLPAESTHRASALATLGTLEMRAKHWGSARARLYAAVELAACSPDRRTEAFVWGAIGELELRSGRYEEAERALLAAYRIRRLHRLTQLQATLTQLGNLELARGRPAEALRYFDNGIAARKTSKANFATFTTWEGRAAALEAMSRRREARESFKRAMAESAAWRNEIVPSEGLETAADVRLGQIASGLVRTAVNETEIWEAFEHLESMRAAGLRRQILVNRTLAGKLPKHHLDLIWEVRQLGLKALRGEPGAEASLVLAEAKLTKLEAETLTIPPGGGRPTGSRGQMERIASSLPDGEAIVSFWTGGRGSRVWVATRTGRASAPLPGEAELRRLVEAQRNAIGKGGGGDESAALYRALFDRIPGRLLASKSWHVVADGPLWSVAWPALRPEGPSGMQYLVQTKTLALLPSAAWLSLATPAPATRLMVAAGDAVHNRADPRLSQAAVAGSAAPLSFWVWPRPKAEPGPAPLELPTLAGSGKELETVCDVWGVADCRAVRGLDLTADRLASEISRRPAVVHLATHLVEDADPADSQDGEAFLALSLNSKLEREGYWTAGVSRLQAGGALVVLSACGSVKGKVLPGAGLQGFGRAWLAAGARGAIGTLWAVPDSDGGFFSRFYGELKGGASPASALRAAQLEAIGEGGRRSLPRYWATYTMIGKD